MADVLRANVVDRASSGARDLIGAESLVSPAELPAEPARRANLLILSDIRFMREGLAEVFGRDDVFQTISVAADPGEAIAVMRAAMPDLVLTNIGDQAGILLLLRQGDVADALIDPRAAFGRAVTGHHDPQP